jgi:predicted nuclease of predicted toxin-antitoxin system
MVLRKVKFLINENVPVKLKRIFFDRGIYCVALREEGWLGIKNGELSNKIRQNNLILVTRDKDFTYLWKKYKVSVIYLAIEPSILDCINLD